MKRKRLISIFAVTAASFFLSFCGSVATAAGPPAVDVPSPYVLHVDAARSTEDFPVAAEIRRWVELLIWPSVVVALVASFRKPLSALLTRARRFTVWGVDISMGDLKNVLSELLEAVNKQVSHEQRLMFLKIRKLGRYELPADFCRSRKEGHGGQGDTPSMGELHETLRGLREAGLVHPQSKGFWGPGEQVELMAFGKFLSQDPDLMKQVGITEAMLREIDAMDPVVIRHELNQSAVKNLAGTSQYG